MYLEIGDVFENDFEILWFPAMYFEIGDDFENLEFEKLIS